MFYLLWCTITYIGGKNTNFSRSWVCYPVTVFILDLCVCTEGEYIYRILLFLVLPIIIPSYFFDTLNHVYSL